MQSTFSPFLISLSKLISNFFNPLTSLLIYFLYFSYKYLTLDESLDIFLPILLITIIPVSVWIIRNVKTGKYSNMDVSNRNQRKSLYVFMTLCLVAYLVYDYLRNGNLDITMFFLLVLLVMMQFSNFFIKSSMHTAVNFYVAALFFNQDHVLGLVWVGIAILVGISRVIVNRHTPPEVLMGAAIAILVSFVYLYVSIQMPYKV